MCDDVYARVAMQDHEWACLSILCCVCMLPMHVRAIDMMHGSMQAYIYIHTYIHMYDICITYR